MWAGPLGPDGCRLWAVHVLAEGLIGGALVGALIAGVVTAIITRGWLRPGRGRGAAGA